jgi:hypothetical protein
MSVLFTTPTKGFQDLACMNELMLALSEHRQALGQTAVDPITAGANAQDKTPWLAIQTWLEENCTSFITFNVLAPPAWTDFEYWTLDTWRNTSGVAGGFSRSVDGTTILRGKIQAGDVILSEIWKEIIDGFCWSPGWGDPPILNRTLLPPATTTESFEGRTKSASAEVDTIGGYNGPQKTLAALQGAMAAAWAAASWTSSPGINGASRSVSITPGETKWSAHCECFSSRLKISSIPTFRPCTLDLYFALSSNSFPAPYDSFETVVTEWNLVPVDGEVSSAQILPDAQLSGIELISTPPGGYSAWSAAGGYVLGNKRYIVLNWDFTNAWVSIE